MAQNFVRSKFGLRNNLPQVVYSSQARIPEPSKGEETGEEEGRVRARVSLTDGAKLLLLLRRVLPAERWPRCSGGASTVHSTHLS